MLYQQHHHDDFKTSNFKEKKINLKRIFSATRRGVVFCYCSSSVDTIFRGFSSTTRLMAMRCCKHEIKFAVSAYCFPLSSQQQNHKTEKLILLRWKLSCWPGGEEKEPSTRKPLVDRLYEIAKLIEKIDPGWGIRHQSQIAFFFLSAATEKVFLGYFFSLPLITKL